MYGGLDWRETQLPKRRKICLDLLPVPDRMLREHSKSHSIVVRLRRDSLAVANMGTQFQSLALLRRTYWLRIRTDLLKVPFLVGTVG